MNFSKKVRQHILWFSVLCSLSAQAQFEKMSMRQTLSELETDLIDDTSNTYLRLMLCGDIIYNSNISKYSQKDDLGHTAYRTWFRQIKPLFFFSDLVVAGSRFHVSDNSEKKSSLAPKEFLAELEYTGFNVLMQANSDAMSVFPEHNIPTILKTEKVHIQRSGMYLNSLDKKRKHPLVLEKKDIRIALMSYTTDTIYKSLADKNFNYFVLDSAYRDIVKAREMLVDFVVLYIDWGQTPDSVKLSTNIDLINAGVDVVLGSGMNSFSGADVLDFTDGRKKLIIDDIGSINSDTKDRNHNKSAIIEIILKRNKASKQVTMHDMGFIPLWTLIDPNRYAVLPINNIEENHIENVNLNYLQYSDMKIALTDLRYTFFDKLQENHYDYNDRVVNDVEQTTFFRKTVLAEQERINDSLIKLSELSYLSLFGEAPPPAEETKRYIIPYDDILKIYVPKKTKKVLWTKDIDIDRDMDTTDQILESGVINIQANKKYYTRAKDTTKPLTAAQIRALDSIKKYKERFYVKDTIAELKAKLRKQKAEEKRIRDSIYQAKINPNNTSTIQPTFEPTPIGGKINPFRDVPKSGIFTPTESPKDNVPIKEIEEYFMVQVFTMAKTRGINLDVYPYLRGYQVRYEDGFYNYLIGRTRSAQVAIELCKNLRKKGLTDAKVVKYTDGKKSDFY